MFSVPIDNPFRAPRIRKGLVRAHGVFQERLDDLPRHVGGAGWGAALIASILGRAGIEHELVVGTFQRGRWQSDHCWVRSGNMILDWAGEQFKMSPWVETVASNPRYIDKRGTDLREDAVIIGGFPGDDALARLAQAMTQWPEEQRASGNAFKTFLERGLTRAIATDESGPQHEDENVFEVDARPLLKRSRTP